jgi:hypothetical protein
MTSIDATNTVNLFLVGAQKSGSTRLASLLAQHPSISVSNPKAPCYFNKKYRKAFQIRRFEEYQRLFDCAKPYRCDASDCYHADFEALKSIYTYNSHCRIVMIIRDPLQMMRSLHQHLLWKCYETVENLNDAFELEHKRRENKCIPRSCHDSNFLMYSDICAVGDQAEFLLNLFGPTQVLLLSSASLRSDPRKTLTELFDWLGLDGMVLDLNKSKANEAVQPRIKALARMNELVSPVVKTKLKLLLLKYGLQTDGIMRRINGRPVSAPDVDFIPSASIKEFVQRQIQKLAATGLITLQA